MLNVICATCADSFLVSDDMIGQQAMCPACGKPTMVQAPQEEKEEGTQAEVAWEYSIVSDFGRMGQVDEKRLNRMGRQGWELVSVFRESLDTHTCFYFKRRLHA
jgi:hypothetical protein